MNIQWVVKIFYKFIYRKNLHFSKNNRDTFAEIAENP